MHVATKNVFESRIFPDYSHIHYNFNCKIGFFMIRDKKF